LTLTVPLKVREEAHNAFPCPCTIAKRRARFIRAIDKERAAWTGNRIHVTAIIGARPRTCDTAVRRRACRSAPRLSDQEDRMKPDPKWTAATLVVLAVATVHAMHAQAIAPVPVVHESDRANANDLKTYDEWQAPSSRSFRARFLDHRTAEDPIVGGAPGRGFTLRIFDGWEKVQIWDDAR
jgi:hypothetical protein